MKFFVFCVIHFLFLHIYGNNGAKILGIFPLPAKSHFTCDNAIMKPLIEAGHDVTVITAFPEQASAENYTSVIDIGKDEFLYVGQSSFKDLAELPSHEMFNLGMGIEEPYCYKVVNSPEFQMIMNSKEKPFDVIFVEILFLYKCFLPIAQKFDIPVIATETTSIWLLADRAINNPTHPEYLSYEFGDAFRPSSFYKRLHNTYLMLLTEWFWYFKTVPALKKFYDDHAKQISSFDEFMNMEPALIFHNNHPSILARPTNPNLIEIGGIHVKNAKPLPRNLKKFIDEAEHGVILFSFGSVTRAALLSAEIQSAFREAFAEIPQRVIWKFEEPMEKVPDNVMLIDWLPQRDILEHKNVRAFISHCGQGGTYEAIYSATPIISCPLFGDQPVNAALLEDLGVAVHLDIYGITKEKVLQALNVIINDTRYYNNMQQLSNVFKDRPMTPQQTVVYWTEYVIRHKGVPHLKFAGAQLNRFQFLLLDVLSVLVLFLIIITFLIRKTIRTLFYRLSKIIKKYHIRKNKSV